MAAQGGQGAPAQGAAPAPGAQAQGAQAQAPAQGAQVPAQAAQAQAQGAAAQGAAAQGAQGVPIPPPPPPLGQAPAQVAAQIPATPVQLPGQPGAPPPGQIPAPGPAPNPLDALVRTLTDALGQMMQHNCLPTPKFSGGSSEDPALFKQKACDYMDDAQIPDAQRTTKFRLCLEGDARDWYNDLVIPAD